MKLAAKILTIVGIIVGLPTIISPIIGLIALNKMKNAKSKSDLTVIAILNLLFCSLLGGVFMLLIGENDLG